MEKGQELILSSNTKTIPIIKKINSSIINQKATINQYKVSKQKTIYPIGSLT